MSQKTQRERKQIIHSIENEVINEFVKSLDFSAFHGGEYTKATQLINKNKALALLRTFQERLEESHYKILKARKD